MKRCCVLSALGFLSLLATIFGIWIPEVSHFWVGAPSLSQATIGDLMTLPTKSDLDRLAQISLVVPKRIGVRNEIISNADRILRGEWLDEDAEIRPIGLPFAENDLHYGRPTQQLRFASMAHVEELLAAYGVTADDKYLAASRDAVNAWAVYEGDRLLDTSFLWNDHAIAQRAFVLCKYWSLLRSSPLLDARSAQLVVRFLARSGRMLAKPGLYTARTNHGMMQNVALLQIASVLQALPESRNFMAVGQARLRSQLRYYQSDEGVVLEHSPGYHALGVQLLAAISQYEDRLDPDFLADVRQRLSKACSVYLQFVRPDDTLPMIGDTTSLPVSLSCQPAASKIRTSHGDAPDLQIFPVSGFAVTWYQGVENSSIQRQSQTVVTWSNFVSHAHKHADEMSIVTWEGGRSILTSAGYWPYADRRRARASSWRGSNGPFLDNELPEDIRTNSLLAEASGGSATFVDLERRNAKSLVRIRRQIATLDRNTWLVIDSANGSGHNSLTTNWTLNPAWKIAQFSPSENRALFATSANQKLLGAFAASAPLTNTLLSRSDQPFGGWMAVTSEDESVVSAYSVQLGIPANAAVVSLWSTKQGDGIRPAILRWIGNTNWSVCLDSPRCDWRVERHDFMIDVSRSANTDRLQLSAPPQVEREKEHVDDLYRSAAIRYPAWRDLRKWRTIATWPIVGYYFLYEAVLFLLRRTHHKTGAIAVNADLLHMTAIAIAAMAGFAVVFGYLRV